MQMFRYLALISPLFLGPSCLAQAVTIRVINASDDRPLRSQPVWVSLLYEKGEATPAKYDANLTLQTDGSGEARFVLPEPPPAHLAVRVGIDQGQWHCGCNILGVIHDVIQNGIVDSAASADELKRSPDLAKAVPSEIRFVVRPRSFLERLLGPLLRQ
jgi:hypothetical protein